MVVNNPHTSACPFHTCDYKGTYETTAFLTALTLPASSSNLPEKELQRWSEMLPQHSVSQVRLFVHKKVILLHPSAFWNRLELISKQECTKNRINSIAMMVNNGITPKIPIFWTAEAIWRPCSVSLNQYLQFYSQVEHMDLSCRSL